MFPVSACNTRAAPPASGEVIGLFREGKSSSSGRRGRLPHQEGGRRRPGSVRSDRRPGRSRRWLSKRPPRRRPTRRMGHEWGTCHRIRTVRARPRTAEKAPIRAFSGGRSRRRSDDLALFRQARCQLSRCWSSQVLVRKCRSQPISDSELHDCYLPRLTPILRSMWHESGTKPELPSGFG